VIDEPTELHKMLERATAPPDESPAGLDAETASLRHDWLGLCELIEQEQASCDGFVGRVTVEQVAARAEKRFEICSAASQRNRTAWSRWLLAAVAASILVAAGVTIVVRSLDGSGAGKSISQEVARNDGLSKPSADRDLSANRKTSAPSQSDRQATSTVDRLAWGDSVDDEITAVGQATTLARHDWYGQSNSASVIRSGLDQLENEIQQGPL
jgi:hypothetical protein